MIHQVLADEAAGYAGHEQVGSGDLDQARDLDLRLAWKGSSLVVDKMPGGAAYPRHSGQARLFLLEPGQVGRYRANFRYTFTECPCNPSWYYEDWLVHIGNGETATDDFVRLPPDHDIDHRVHLYGGSRRSGHGSRPG